MLVNLTTTQVETLFGELEYIEPRLKALSALFTDFPNTFFAKRGDGLTPGCIDQSVW
jgi:hypothetical protein